MSDQVDDQVATAQQVFRVWQAFCLEPGAASRKEELQSKACQFLQSTLGGDSQSADALLAILVQELGPAMASTMQARLAALSCLVGALQACQNACLSFKVTELLGNFLLKHCGPLKDDDDDLEDYDEQVRDTAVKGLGCLITCPSTAITSEDPSSLYTVRLRLSKSAVESRCAAPELFEDDPMDVDYARPTRPVTSGLSTLPRSRRSLCFDLIQSTVDAIAKLSTTHPLDKKKTRAIEADLVSFASLVYQCLHGESDPRCLLQLLRLFASVLVTWHPLVDGAIFPLSEFFDAVAPYYPILFTPPPNDTNGITRQGLRHAIMAVLTCSLFDAAARKASRDIMINMSLGLFLERLVPPPEDGPSTLSDQQEGLEDLMALLYSDESVFGLLQAPEMRQVSEALMVVHDETSTAVVHGGPDAGVAKVVADQCRSAVSKIALSTEAHKPLWNAFVVDSVKSLSGQLSSASKGRMAIAYIACLASSGGPRTLSATLSAGLTPLLKTVSSNLSDGEDVVTAAYGIGALFASCRAALEGKEGIVIHPHPLAPYSASAVDKVCSLLDNSSSASLPVKIGAARALESIVIASPSSLLKQEQVTRLSSVVMNLSQVVLANLSGEDETEWEEQIDWIRACTLTLGGFLGKTLGSSGPSPAAGVAVTTIVEEQELGAFIRDEVFPKLLSSAITQKENREDSSRPDRATLAEASTFSIASASVIVRPIVDSLRKALGNDDFVAAQGPAHALSSLCRKKGSYAPQAFQDCVGTGGFNVVAELSRFEPSKTENKGLEERFGMSTLELPPSTEDISRVEAAVGKAYSVVPLILSAYSVPAATSHLESLASCIDRVIPPLTDSDIVAASVALPFLSVALQSAVNPGESTSVQKSLCAMIDDLAYFTLNARNHPSARSFAAQCLHTTVTRFSQDSQTCPVWRVVAKTIMPTLRSSLRPPGDRRGSTSVAATVFADSLSLLAVIGSAAACRGGVSSKTANAAVSFLVDLACEQQAANPFTEGGVDVVDLSVFDESIGPGTSVTLSIVPASAFGSMLSTPSERPLWKQRLVYLAVKKMEDYHSRQEKASAGFSLGMVATACHVVCSSTVATLSAKHLNLVTEIIAGSLAHSALQKIVEEDDSILKLLLASLVKLLSVNESSFATNVYFVVTGTLRAFAIASTQSAQAELASKLLALQVLEAVSHVSGAHQSLQAVKPAVVSVLANAMNHPSSLLRQAAVEVRNTWFLIE